MAGMYLAENVLRALPESVRDTVVEALNPLRRSRVMARPSPKWITLFVTNYCNARCEHCFYWRELNNREPEMSTAELGRVIASLDSPVNTLRLSGGEPFLRKDLEDLVIAADRSGRVRKVSIPTHGMQTDLTERVTALLPLLRSCHLNISVSLDGMAERHDGNRKIRGGFNRAIGHLRNLVRLAREHENFSPSVSVSLTRGLCVTDDGSQPELLDLIALLRDDVGLEDIGFDHIRSAETDVIGLAPQWCSGFTPPPTAEAEPEVRNGRHDDVQLSAEERRGVNDLLRGQMQGRASHLTHLRLDTQQRILESRKRVVDCLAGYVDCVIYPGGDVAVCEFSRPFANLAEYDHDLPRLMRAAVAAEARAATRHCACTHPCHLSDSLAYDAGFLRKFLARP